MTPKTDQPPAHDDDVIASLRALPPRAPVEPAQARERVQWILVDLGVQSEIAAIMTQVIHSYYTVNVFF